MTKVKPLGDRVLVQPMEEQEAKKGGIIIPIREGETTGGRSSSLLGTGVKSTTMGEHGETTVKAGDKVLVSKYGGTEIKVDDETYLIMREDDILGMIGIKSTLNN